MTDSRVPCIASTHIPTHAFIHRPRWAHGLRLPWQGYLRWRSRASICAPAKGNREVEQAAPQRRCYCCGVTSHLATREKFQRGSTERTWGGELPSMSSFYIKLLPRLTLRYSPHLRKGDYIGIRWILPYRIVHAAQTATELSSGMIPYGRTIALPTRFGLET